MNANVVDVRNTFSEYLNRASYQGQRIVIERRGKPVGRWFRWKTWNCSTPWKIKPT